MSSRDTSEETEQLCDNTIDLMKSFQRMLQSAKAQRPTGQPEAPSCPCGRSHSQQPQSPQQQQQQQPAVCSNVSNLVSSSQGRVLTSPSEIRLLLRLESWLGENGVLVVKPSVHREEECGGDGNNNTGTSRPALQLPQPPPPPHRQQQQQQQASSSETMEDVCAGDCDEADEEDAEVREPQQQHHQHRRQLHQLMARGSVSAAASRPRQQHQQPHQQPQQLQHQHQHQHQHQQPHQQPQQLQHQHQHRRERLLVKRPVSVSAVASAGKAGGGARSRREAEQAGGSSERGETMSLIRKLHRLLSVELKRPGPAE